MNKESFSVTSSGQVSVSVAKSGTGPALLLVHGAGLDAATSWSRVTPALSRDFTVYEMNRRGRAPSGDAPEYSLSAESDDLVSVAQAIGGPLMLLGHSYGGLLSLVSLSRLSNVSNLILYEPPVFEKSRGPQYMAVLREMELACEAGDGDRAALLFLRDQVGSPPEVVEGYRGSPLWAKFVEVAPTLARESLVVNTLGWSPSSLNGWRGPATMLLGSETKGELRDAALRLCNAIAGCRLSILEGQGHGAMLTAPDLFVTRVLEAAGLRPQSHQA